ncbi:MAG: transposase [Flavobacteriales bacterium Tduv]
MRGQLNIINTVKSWRDKWNKVIVFFEIPLDIRNIIHTINLIENLNGKIRKHMKVKIFLPTDNTVFKFVFFTLKETTKNCSIPI